VFRALTGVILCFDDVLFVQLFGIAYLYGMSIDIMPQMPGKYKRVIVTLLILNSIRVFVQEQVSDLDTKPPEMCWYFYCTDVQRLRLNALLIITIFLFKHMVKSAILPKSFSIIRTPIRVSLSSHCVPETDQSSNAETIHPDVELHSM
jgi:hypothetical protein